MWTSHYSMLRTPGITQVDVISICCMMVFWVTVRGTRPPPGVWFTATLYKGQVPTITPYPTGGDLGTKYWRLFICVDHLNLTNKECSLFLVNEYKPHGTRKTERTLAFTRKHNEQVFLDNGCKKLNKADNEYFCVDKDNSWWCPKPPIWTKIYLTRNVALTPLQYLVIFGILCQNPRCLSLYFSAYSWTLCVEQFSF